ncbi:hypothetical protein BKA65DRAFT_518036 [Rhexocercosporidium sp. MPI-PUGE-AT-0058]|nr:hypothetical protein BKA65DRAFT_518036 [Rhexocercosporidium sp. MPI-PUGE-AT-0058]
MDHSDDQTMDAIGLIYPSGELQNPGAELTTETYHDLSVCGFKSISVSLDPPMSFRERHRFLDGVYDSYLDPEHISAKDLVYIARQAGLCMEEVHAWFEDESHRRAKLLDKLRGHLTNEPRPCSPESLSSYAPSQMTISATRGSSDSFQIGLNYYSQTQSIFSGPSSPGTVSGDYLQVPSRVRRGRPPGTESSSPPHPKRQKVGCHYPCVDCSKAFPANRWSEHVKRVHFPDYIWECPKPLCEWKPFYRTDNFTTHLLREHRCNELEVSQLKASCKFEVIGFYHKICGICSIDLKSRDESIEHIREHLREISRRKVPPKDLGLSEWKEQCPSTHNLQRGVHYQIEKGELPIEIDENVSNGRDGPDGEGSDGNDGHDQHGSNPDWYNPYQNDDNESSGGAGSAYHPNLYFFDNTYRTHANLVDPTILKDGPQIYNMNYSYSGNPPPSPYPSTYPCPQPRRLSIQSDTFDCDEIKERGRCTYPECGKIFKDLKAHLLTHQNERPEKCPIPTCDYHIKGFARKYDKNRHTLTHYKGVMVCGFCPGSGTAAEKSFNRADVFKRHLTSVHGVEQTPPNSRKKSTVTQGSTNPKKLSGYAPDATGKCSTCSGTFSNAQDFYEHLDDCVLRIVQQEEPSEAINAARLAEVEQDQAVQETLRSHALAITTTDVFSADEDEDEDDEEDNDFTFHTRSRKKPKSSTNPVDQVQKSRGLTHSKGGVTLNAKGRKPRKDYPSSWGSGNSQIKMKKRVPAFVDGPRKLWRDNMMLDTDYEVRMKFDEEKTYVTDLDVQTLRRAEAFHESSDEDKGPWIADELTDVGLDGLMAAGQE